MENGVSLIHKALRQAERASNQGPQNDYNPLSAPRQSPQTAISPLVIIGGLLIWAAIAVVAWPVAQLETLSTEPGTSTSKASTSSVLKPESVLDIEPERSTAGNPISDRVTTDADVIGPSQDALSNAILAIEALPGVASASAHNEPLLPERTIAAAMPKPLPALGRTIALSLTQSTPSTLKTQAPAQPSATQAGADGAPGFERSIESVPEAELTFASPVERSTDSVIVQSKNLWQQQVQQAVAEGAIEQAEAILKQWLGAAPTDPVPRIWLARSYINNGFYRAAEPLLMTLTGSDANALLGLIYERTDRPQLAAKRFEALYQVNPENGRWLLFWAINSENSGQLAKSRSLYQTYLTLFELEDPALTQFSQQRLTTLGGY
ncbi:MAG: hypothetical protein ACI9D8_001458 [Reinekea sp.]